MPTGTALLQDALNEPGFKDKLIQVCSQLGCRPTDLLKVMANESGIIPSRQNPNGGATGLIQFMPDTAKALGTTTANLATMSRTQQLDYVLKYYTPYKGQLSSAGALYAVTYLPGRFQKPMTTDMLIPGSPALPTGSPVLSSKYDTTELGRKYYTQNIGLDVNKDGFITVADLTAVTENKARSFGITDDLNTTYAGSSANSAAQNNVSDYINNTYTTPLKSIPTANLVDAMRVGNETFAQYTTKTAIVNSLNLDGEKALLSGVEQVSREVAVQTNAILSRVGGFLPSEQHFLVMNNLFEFYPDKMRAVMTANAGSGVNANYSHAWRAPAKLAITANLTIPGCSGFRIGQIFWIGRTYDSYKRFGAFQLFGLTENIDMSRGWTTQLYSRFNAMPERYLVGVKSE